MSIILLYETENGADSRVVINNNFLALNIVAVDNEIVVGSGVTFTLAQVPISGTQHIFALGQRLTPGIGNDYIISGAVITLANSFPAGSILADYKVTGLSS